MTEKAKLFIGIDPNNCDLEAQAVLHWSLVKNSSIDLEIEWMKLSRDPTSFWYSTGDGRDGWNTVNWATPFSGFRWGIPQFCNFEGKAIYLDSDMIVRSDIRKLWEQDFNGKSIIAKGPPHHDRFCVALLDCAKLKPTIPEITVIKRHPTAYLQINNFFAVHTNRFVQPFIGNWNCIDGENLAMHEIDIFHHSSMEHQLCHKYSGPRLAKEGKSHWYTGNMSEHPRDDARRLFDDLLEEATNNGFGPENYIIEPFGFFQKSFQNFRGDANPYVR